MPDQQSSGQAVGAHHHQHVRSSRRASPGMRSDRRRGLAISLSAAMKNTIGRSSIRRFQLVLLVAALAGAGCEDKANPVLSSTGGPNLGGLGTSELSDSGMPDNTLAASAGQ